MAGLNAKVIIDCVVKGDDQLGETPLWCSRTGKLWWVDIEIPRLQSYDPQSGQHTSIATQGTFLGSLALTGSDAHLVAVDLGLHRLDPTTQMLTPFVEVESGFDNRLNDGRVDAKGRLWIGTMDNQYNRANGSLYRIDADGSVHKMFGDIKVSNGMAFTPDNRTFYFTDTRRFQTWAFDFDLDAGRISNRRLFADYSATGDRPDGACMDADGCLWTAFFGGSRLVRYRPDGTIDRTIALPVTNPTCICFGGNDLKTLYITTASKFLTDAQLQAEPLAGSLLAIENIGQGLAENRFAG
ncbi:MAG: SMP-30/gluconolactonase/LRE family protein [Rhodospirillales bacterium]|nr:SMP-30/gluconolactonase/LRE family protein [Rhodospirillales bacterium]